MNNLTQAGRFFFAASMIGLGVQQLIYKGFITGLEIVPDWIPGHALWAYAAGVILLLSGVSIALNRRARFAAGVLGLLFLLCLLLLHGPRLDAIIHDGSERSRAFETLAICGGALVLAGALPVELGFPDWNNALEQAVEPGRVLLGISLMVFGVDHFLYAGFVATLIPSWIPGHLFWTYFTGMGFVASAGAIATRIWARLASTLLGMMFLLWVALVHAPRVAAHVHNGDEWNSALVALAMSGIGFVTAGAVGNVWKPARAHIRVKTAAATLTILCAATGNQARASDKPAASPVLIELFTSEGCSSCPPVDDWVQKLDASQPIPGAKLIVLSEHVDYWNHDGWKDPYSSSALTDRQSLYARALRLRDVYTPQLIVDGSDELPVNNPEQVKQILLNAAATPPLAVRLTSVSVKGNDAPVVRGRVEADTDGEAADVYVAVVLAHAESRVRGENGGKHLTHVAVVQSLKKIGNVETQKDFNGSFQVKLKSGIDPANVQIIAFVQKPGPGKVLGATFRQAPFDE